MSKLTIVDFLMGRDKASPITPEMKADAEDLLEKVNLLLLDFYRIFPDAPVRVITSGYRPAAINAATAGAAKKSKHMICQAVDLSDSDKLLAKYLTLFPEKLIEFDLYIEDPAYTKNWTHLQLCPPKSKKRKFIP